MPERGLLDIQKHHPNIEIELDGGNRPVDLSRGEADIALRLVAACAAGKGLAALPKSWAEIEPALGCGSGITLWRWSARP